ncbi:MAG TPA: hypothetical protein PKV73_16650 [Agriterribacter sp.]|nr:hypothetical protein [Agriterribacter sp.]
MKPDRIIYNKLFPLGQFTNEKIGVEIQLDDGDSPEKALELAKTMVEKFHRENNAGLYLEVNPEYTTTPLTGSATVQNSIDYKVIERLEKLIDDAKDISELDMYYGDIVKHGMLEEYQTKKQALSPLSKQI